MGDTNGAKADLQESLKLAPSFTQSWVKIASVHMEQSDVAKTFEAFEEAIKHNASDPDIYYHRGQGMWSDICVARRADYRCVSAFHHGRLCKGGRKLHGIDETRRDIRVLTHSTGGRTVQVRRRSKEQGDIHANARRVQGSQRTAELLVS